MDKYIIIKGDIILRVYESASIDSVKKALVNVGITDYSEIRKIDKGTTFAKIDENNIYVGQAKPHNGMKYIESIPEIPDDYIAKFNGDSWEYEKNIDGIWYNKDTGYSIEVANNSTEYNLVNYTRLKPIDEFHKWDNDSWIFDIDKYRHNIKNQIRVKCRQDREKVFPNFAYFNLLAGVAYDNELVTIQNYKKLAEYYRNIVYINESLIDAAQTKEDVDTIFNSIVFPTEEDIIKKVKE